MSTLLHFGVVGDSPPPSFLGWSDTRRSIRIKHLLHVRDDHPALNVSIEGSWEVWGVDDQRGHRSLHLVVKLDDDYPHPDFVEGIKDAITLYTVGRVVDVAYETTEDWATKVRAYDLSRRLIPTVHNLTASAHETAILALEEIHSILDANSEWDSSTIEHVAETVTRAGYTIHEPTDD